MSSFASRWRTRRCQRLALIFAAFLLSVTFLFILNRSSRQLQDTAVEVTPRIGRCSGGNQTRSAEIWRATESKYSGLSNDKFTIAISTFHRPKELSRVLQTLLADKIPSLLEIAVIWNNFNETPPEAFTSEHGVSVRYRVPPRDSLSEKLWPDPQYRTRAILLSDDDVYYRPSDVEYAFQMWRQFGQTRITGALARCVSGDEKGDWEYQFCSQNDDAYALVLTNLAFTDITFLDSYFSDDPAMIKIRKYVDDGFNCEDIALNFVASLHRRSGPLLVRGHHQYVNLNPAQGISQKPGHIEARSKCLNVFAEAIGCMPLVDQTGHLERGVKHNVWYKSVWDVYSW